MRLDELFPQHNFLPASALLQVKGVTADSRAVEPGFVFYAVPGVKADGLSFAAAAIAKGAIAVVSERDPERPVLGAALVRVDDVRAALSHGAAALHPRQPETIVAVTGTSGKTSVAVFTQQIWIACGKPAALLGTIGIVAPNGSVKGSLTTPDPVSLHQALDELAGEGVSHLVMEASSHGLDQRRLDSVRLSAAAFLNLSRDQLDYHKDLDEYLDAKLRLFRVLMPKGAPAIVDADSDVADRVIKAATEAGLKILTIGKKGTYLRLVSAEADGLNTRLVLNVDGYDHAVVLPLAGSFQVANAMAAASFCLATGSDSAQVFAALEKLHGAPGRLDLVGTRGTAPVFVDYAHKPDALEKALLALRPFASNRLIVVFGCGGDRDTGKRAIMGDIAARFADFVIVTDDNPRSEEPNAIRSAIVDGARAAKKAPVVDIGDRASAIRSGVSMLKDGDVLLIAGKGHETGQIIGKETFPFSDHEAARAALKEFKA